jgi:hypothetical protein
MISSRESAAERREREGVRAYQPRVVEPRACLTDGCQILIPSLRIAASPNVKYCDACGLRRALDKTSFGKKRRPVRK